LEAAGDAALYPHDAYFVEGALEVRLPPRLAAAGPPEFGFYDPVAIFQRLSRERPEGETGRSGDCAFAAGLLAMSMAPHRLPLDATLTAGTGMAGKRITAEWPARNNDKCLWGFRLRVEREAVAREYVETMLWIPFLFAAVFAHLLLFARQDGAPPLHEFMAGVVAAILAVLPLRQVLVPAEVSGLTRADLWLAGGIVAIVAVVLARHCRDVWQQR
jgi:hypothetical protein